MILLLREERNLMVVLFDIFKKDIADYKDKWDILGNFVGNDELSTEKSDEK